MAYDSKKVETAQALFAAAIDLMKENYNAPADKIPTSMAIADLAAKAMQWDCIAAQDLAYNVLEEVNEHTLAKAFKTIAEVHNDNFDTEEA